MRSKGQRESRKHEAAVADALGGKTVAGSGSSWSHDADVMTSGHLVEAKWTGAKSYRLAADTWMKISNEAARVGLVPLMSIAMEGQPRLVVMDEDDFIELLLRGNRDSDS